MGLDNDGIWMLVIVGVYFAPVIVATSRRAVNRKPVGVVNLFLGWTLIGWVVALAMAMGRTDADLRR